MADERKPEIIKYYDLQGTGIASRAVSEAEVAELLDMFGSRAWQVFMDLRQGDANEFIEQGMEPAVTDEQKSLGILARSMYQGCRKDLDFEKELRQAINESSPVPQDELTEKV